MAYVARATLAEVARAEKAEVPSPAGLSTGDVIVFVLGLFNFESITGPAGSVVLGGPTKLGTNHWHQYFAILHSGASAYSFTYSGSREVGAAAFGFSGRGPSLAAIVKSTVATGTGTTATASSVTATAGADLICVASETGAQAATPPSGMTERLDSGEGEVFAEHAATLDNVSAGASGTKAFTWPASSEWAAQLIAIPKAEVQPARQQQFLSRRCALIN